MLRPPSRPTSRAGGRDVWGSSSRLRARSRRALALSLPSSCLDRKRAAGTPQDTRGAVMCTVVLLGAMPRATLPSRGRRAETPCPSIARCRSTTQISPPSSPRVRGDKTRRSFQRDDECPYADHEAGPESVRSQVKNAAPWRRPAVRRPACGCALTARSSRRSCDRLRVGDTLRTSGRGTSTRPVP
jgi:hypothetical protein